LINRDTLAQMRRGALLINTARGGLVDEEALADALSSGQLAGAGLDAFVTEPLPLSNRLSQLKNVVLSPHIAGQDHASIHAMGCLAAECLAKLALGQPVPAGCLVNPAIGPDWKW
jgi:D-3-phosphoglycerate dehydrogenase